MGQALSAHVPEEVTLVQDEENGLTTAKRKEFLAVFGDTYVGGDWRCYRRHSHNGTLSKDRLVSYSGLDKWFALLLILVSSIVTISAFWVLCVQDQPRFSPWISLIFAAVGITFAFWGVCCLFIGALPRGADGVAIYGTGENERCVVNAAKLPACISIRTVVILLTIMTIFFCYRVVNHNGGMVLINGIAPPTVATIPTSLRPPTDKELAEKIKYAELAQQIAEALKAGDIQLAHSYKKPDPTPIKRPIHPRHQFLASHKSEQILNQQAQIQDQMLELPQPDLEVESKALVEDQEVDSSQDKILSPMKQEEQT